MKAAVALFVALAAGFFVLALYGKYQTIKAEFREEQARERAARDSDLREEETHDAGDGNVP